MTKLYPTADLDKDLLVTKIIEQFQKADQLSYQRSLLEFFDEKGSFIGDNLFETTFESRENQTPLIYEVSGPYDTISKQYATIGKIYQAGELLFQCDLKAGIYQRTAAMVWIYLDALAHEPGKILLFGAGKVGLETALYLKHFNTEITAVDYHDLEPRSTDFETPLSKTGITATFQVDPDLSLYDTIIMATTTDCFIIDHENISKIKPGAVVISLCTTSLTGEIDPKMYGRDDVEIFLDIELTKTFTEDMKQANKSGYLERAMTFEDLLRNGPGAPNSNTIKLVRLTGTPMQNIAVIKLVLKRENLIIQVS